MARSARAVLAGACCHGCGSGLRLRPCAACRPRCCYAPGGENPRTRIAGRLPLQCGGLSGERRIMRKKPQPGAHHAVRSGR